MSNNSTHTAEDLKMMQALPISIKVRMTEERIRQWYQYWGGKVCVSFSGGKDSTVLMHIARGLYPDITAVFSNTGLEYPEIQRFVKEYGNVDVVTPSMKFVDVVTQYGYPLIGKEVAEAIYYARRIRSQTGNAEREDGRAQASRTMREADRRRGDLAGRYTDGSILLESASTELVDVSERGKTEVRTARIPKWGDFHRKVFNIDKSDPRTKDICYNWRRGCL